MTDKFFSEQYLVKKQFLTYWREEYFCLNKAFAFIAELVSTKWIVIATIVGVASGLIGILYSESQFLPIAFEKEPYAKVTVEGLKANYMVGEPIDFHVRLEGYGCHGGFPDVWIKPDGVEEEVIWARQGEIRLMPAGVSCPNVEVYEVRHIGDMERYQRDPQERLRTIGVMPITMDREGTYIVQVAYGEQTLIRFDVIAR